MVLFAFFWRRQGTEALFTVSYTIYAQAQKREEEFRRQQSEQKFNSKSHKEREEQWKKRNDRLAGHGGRSDNYVASGNRNFYSTPEGLDRDATEEEIDNNLGQISSGLGRLKMMGLAMSEELESQDSQLKRYLLHC